MQAETSFFSTGVLIHFVKATSTIISFLATNSQKPDTTGEDTERQRCPTALPHVTDTPHSIQQQWALVVISIGATVSITLAPIGNRHT
jgi:hypothetical protein